MPASSAPLFIIKGRWWSGARVAEMIRDGSIHFALSADSTVIPEDSARKATSALEAIPAKPTKLGTYIKELAGRGYMYPKLIGHEVARVPDSTDYTVKVADETSPGVALEQTLLSPGGRVPQPTPANFSTWVSVAAILESDRLQVMPRLSFNPETGQMELGFPGVHPQDDLHLVAGHLTCLALNANRAVPGTGGKGDESEEELKGGGEDEPDKPKKKKTNRRRRQPSGGKPGGGKPKKLKLPTTK